MRLISKILFFAGAIVCGSITAAEDVIIGDRTLRVADGYQVELAVDSSLVGRPIAVARDERGRLYVTDSGGMTERAEKQLAEKPHRIRRLEDVDGDGRYDKSTLFADKMMFPEGCLWYEGSLYVAAPPEIWKLTDEDDDGVSDKREVWFNGTTLTGCGNDLHGPYLGHDGRIYWCKGAFAEQRHKMSDGKELVTQSSHIFRAKPDGSEMESVLTGGMDNPVNVAFLPNGERFLSCTFFQHPEAGLRDGLIHAIYGGVYGKKHDSIYAHPMTGDVMPVLNHQGAAAPCGLIAGSSQLFGGGFDQHLFACYFNLHKVVRHELVPNGPTYETRDVDFLACDHPDFHPTDVFEDADGSLLIVDTGGWYKVCCPTSQLAKPDVLGAVYRVRKKGAAAVVDPLGSEIPWDSLWPSRSATGLPLVNAPKNATEWNSKNADALAALLSDARFFVQRRATASLRREGAAAVAPLRTLLKSESSATVRGRAVWALAGIDNSSARAANGVALNDEDLTVRQAAIHAAGLWLDAAALESLLKIVRTDASGPARAAAEAIGRIRDPSAVPVLFAALDDVQRLDGDVQESLGPDGARRRSVSDASGAPADAAARIREHALIYAIIEIGDSAAARAGLSSSSPAVVRAALVALDQMDNGGLRPDDVIPRMSDPDAALRATAAWIVNQHTDWGASLAEFFGERLARASSLAPDEQTQDQSLLASLAGSPEIQSLLLKHLQDDQNAAAQMLTLQVLSSSGLSSVPAAWLDALATVLEDSDTVTLPLALEAAQRLPLPKDGHPALKASLAIVSARIDLDPALRLTAIDAAGAGLVLDANTFDLLSATLTPETPMPQRTMAANAIAASALTPDQLNSVLEIFRNAGPMELPKLLPAFEKSGSEELGLKLVDVLLKSEGLRGLRPDLITPLLSKYPASVQTAGKALIKLLNASVEEQTAMLEKMLTDLPEGDVRRGHEVFMGKKGACNTCHKLGYGGGRLGPDLTNIGRVRNRRDIVEALIFPSASIVRGYEPITAELDDGRVVSGIISSESADEIVVAIDAQKTSHVARSGIVQILPSAVSSMPNGLITLLSQQELADLVAFLQSDQR